ncbi:hypothetical protein Salat_1997400 [Sesamum alatum]|uniref:Uncharacterized protein n=1 Tax=Sesamum alatum TaxID=300844 RepID=A0AAE2CFT7_9LAMI|nr:hypothetical protein Salat_1997400 [Sesamum alatum]
MNTVSRNPTVRISRRAEEYSYEAEERRDVGPQKHGWRIFSTRRSSQNLSRMTSSWSYRRERARKRQIFLQTYKLGSISSRGKFQRSGRKLKKIVLKVKSAVVSILAFVRGGALRSCESRSAIRAASPTRVVRFC